MKRSLILLWQLIADNIRIEILREYYTRLSRLVIRNPRLFILWPISIAFILSYPALFSIYTSHGLTSHSYITDYKSVGIDHSSIFKSPAGWDHTSDLEVRQLWIQRSFLGTDDNLEFDESNALDKDFLLQVLSLQNQLTKGINFYRQGQDLQLESKKSPMAIVHSPLLYWDNNSLKLMNDKVLKTVHTSANKKSPAGLTISHTSVLSGIVTINGLVKFADALLVSLFYIPSQSEGVPDAGTVWDENLLNFLQTQDESNSPFVLFSKDKKDLIYQNFQMSFSPLKRVDDVILFISYTFLLGYFILSLSNTHSVKSRLGLFVAFTVEIAISILSAISLTSYFFKQVDLFFIPLQVLPFVVIVVGMENMLGMVNTLSALPEELSMSRKLSTSMSTRGLSSTLIVLADLVILICIMPFVGSSTKKFCVFAAIAIVIDHFLHLTYFVAVLSVDTRRLELEDLLRSNDKDGLMTNYHSHSHNQNTFSRFGGNSPWHSIASKLLGDSIILPSSSDDLYTANSLPFRSRLGLALLRIKAPITTTIVGSLFMISFLILANLRWIDDGGAIDVFGIKHNSLNTWTLPSSVEVSSGEYNVTIINADKFSFFLNKKSFAVELSQCLHADTHSGDFSISVLVQEPLMMIDKTAFKDIDYKAFKYYNKSHMRSKISYQEPEVNFDINIIDKFDIHYLLEFLTSLVFVCSVAGLILKVFIKDDQYQSLTVDKELSASQSHNGDKTVFNYKDLVNGHFLDVLKITTSSNPFIVSVGMDHKILVWSPITTPIPPPTELPLPRQLWPVTKVVMSEPGNLIAVFSKSGMIKCWSRLSMSWTWTVHIDELRNDQSLEAFFRKKTLPTMASRRRMAKPRDSIKEQSAENSPKRTKKRRERPEFGNSLSRTMSIDSTFDRSTDLKLLQQNQDYDFIVVLKNGSMVTVSTETGEKSVQLLSEVPIITADKIISPRVNDRLVCNTEEGKLVVATAINNKWKVRSLPVQEKYNTGKSLITPSLLSRSSSFNNTSLAQVQQLRADLNKLRPYVPRHTSLLSNSFNLVDVENEERRKEEVALFANTETAAVSFVGMLVRTRGLIAELIDVQTGTMVKRFNIGQFKPGTFKVFHSTPVHCRFCGSASISSFSLCYNEIDKNTLIMQTFTIDNRAKNNICLRVERDPRETRCLGFERVTEHQHWLEGVEGWCISDLNMILGIRRKDSATDSIESADTFSTSYSSSVSNSSTLSSRNKKQKIKDEQYHIEDIWEGFSLTASGKATYHEIPKTSNEGLLIKSIGPVAKFGHKSIVVSFGNILKVLYTGNANLFDSEVDTDEGVNQLGFINRRKRMNVVSYQMTHSTDYGSTGQLD